MSFASQVNSESRDGQVRTKPTITALQHPERELPSQCQTYSFLYFLLKNPPSTSKQVIESLVLFAFLSLFPFFHLSL